MMSEGHLHLQKVIRLQRKILKALKADSEYLLGKTPDLIVSYARENRVDFYPATRKPRTVSKNELIRAIRSKNITFFADFHTFDQAQLGALRIFREVVRPSEDWCLGLEMIPSQFQKELDQFQANQISVQEFHKLISYRKEWGFPWKNYAPLFKWAREAQVKLIALNRPKEIFISPGESELHSRDQWASGIITDLIQNNQKLQMLVLYGEHHVGSRHLPARFKETSESLVEIPLTWAVVHQNEDSLYWRAVAENLDLQREAIQLKKIFTVFFPVLLGRNFNL
jgi:hypothetical protein